MVGLVIKLVVVGVLSAVLGRCAPKPVPCDMTPMYNFDPCPLVCTKRFAANPTEPPVCIEYSAECCVRPLTYP